MTATPAKFWARVDTSAGPDACHPWTGARTRDPYGNPSYGVLQYQTVHYVAHRLAWILTNGDPGDQEVCHTCDNPPCCNLRHLFLGDHSANMRDRRDKGRHTKIPERDTATGQWVKA